MPKNSKVYFNKNEILNLIDSRRVKDKNYPQLLDRYEKAFLKGYNTSVLSIDNDVDNQIFSIIQSLVSHIQSVEIQDIFNPPDLPNPSEITRSNALKLQYAASDFWFENHREVDLQIWARTCLIKGDFFGFLRIDPKSDYPLKYDMLDPSEVILASDSIDNIQNQPWIARQLTTNISNLKRFVKNNFSNDKERIDKIYQHLALLEPSATITLYDFWSKVEGGQNTLLTSGGVEIYSKPWPFNYLNLYPFFQYKDIPILKRSRSISTVSMLIALQERFGKETRQIRENAEYVGNPPIVVDVESGVDINKIEGRPRLIVRKYKEGDFRIERVPSLPAYVQALPRETYQQMLKNAGWNELMMQARVGGGQREKGALAILLRSGYVQLNPKLKNLKSAIDQANEIFKGLLFDYSATVSKSIERKAGKIYLSFSPQDWKGIYRSNCRISGLELEKEQMDRNQVFAARKLGLFSKRKALEELGVKDVDKVLEDLEEEEKSRLKFEVLKAKFLQSFQKPTLGEEKPKEEPELYTNYTNFMGNILMPAFRAKLKTIKFKGKVQVLEPDESKAVAEKVKLRVPLEEDRFHLVEVFKDIADRIEFEIRKDNDKSKNPEEKEKEKE